MPDDRLTVCDAAVNSPEADKVRMQRIASNVLMVNKVYTFTLQYYPISNLNGVFS